MCIKHVSFILIKMVEQLQHSPTSRKIMVVVDSTKESIDALNYTLSCEVVPQDELILVLVESLISWKNPFTNIMRKPILSYLSTSKSIEGKEVSSGDILEEMKNACNVIQPNVNVRTIRIQTEVSNKADAILWQSKSLEIDLLILGQKSRSNSIIG